MAAQGKTDAEQYLNTIPCTVCGILLPSKRLIEK
jgi:hypothetical protein